MKKYYWIILSVLIIGCSPEEAAIFNEGIQLGSEISEEGNRKNCEQVGNNYAADLKSISNNSFCSVYDGTYRLYRKYRDDFECFNETLASWNQKMNQARDGACNSCASTPSYCNGRDGGEDKDNDQDPELEGYPYLEWTIEDECNDNLGVQLRFFDFNNNIRWPSGNYIHVIRDTFSRTFLMECHAAGSEICFGASPRVTNPDSYWGKGMDGDENCAACCETCPDYGTKKVYNGLICGN